VILRFGPDNATLTVQTRRGGAAAKAGHDLLLLVTRWEGELEVDGGAGGVESASLTADSTSLRVQKGEGGMMPLGDADKDNIHQTIDDEVLKRGDIAFRSTSIDGSRVQGELTLGSATRPIAFDLDATDDSVAATITVMQSDFGMKPYSALFGALKVHDGVVISLQSR
jgi:polyisoprenoid-binding protein YceI